MSASRAPLRYHSYFRSRGKAAQSAITFTPRHDAVSQLQSSVGNRALTSLLHAGTIQTKSLRIGAPDDSYEREADSVADEVSNRLADDTQSFQTHLSTSESTEQQQSPPAASLAKFENAFGRDLSHVRIHVGSEAEQAARALNARAFTVGSDIVFGRDEFSPHTRKGARILAHELAHVNQQSAGAGNAPSVQRKAVDEEEEKKSSAPPTGAPKKVENGLWHGIKSIGSSIWEGIKAVGGEIWSGTKAAASGIATGAKAVGGAVATGAKAVASGVVTGAKAVGSAIATGAEKVWNGVTWVGRQLWDKVTGIFGRVAHWIDRLPTRVGRLLSGIWEGVKTLRPWSLSWWESLFKVDTWTDFLQWVGRRILELAEIAGLGEIYETVADFIKFNTRTLTSAEMAVASQVFGGSVNLNLVRVDERAVVGPAFTDREYASFHTINGWGGLTEDTLLHELTHVWQYGESGAIYMPQAIHAQLSVEKYVYGGAVGLQNAKAAGRGIRSFNREQQAQIVQDFYRIKKGMNPTDPMNAGSVADLPLYADFVKDVSTLTTAQLLA